MLDSRAKLAAVMTVLVAGALGSLDFVDEIRRDFKMGVVFPRATNNLQTFNGALGGVQASPITQSSDPAKPFAVDGDTFNDFQTAANRACDNQHNSCAEVANSKKGSLTVGDCDQQNTQCKSAASSATVTAFTSLTSSSADFDFFCEL